MPTHTFTLNGERVTVDVEDDVRLLWVIRDILGVTGPKYGCGINVCKACTSHINGKAFNPCSVPVGAISDDDEVTTIEGLADGDTLHPMQEMFREHHALQCGFCTPGMVMSAIDLVQKHPEGLSEEQIRHGLEGNLCRCTGYHNIVKAIAAGAKAMGNERHAAAE